MSRLIDADDFIEKLTVAPMIQEAMRKALNHMPIIEVVRCKDCKHSEHWYGNKRLCHLWSEIGIDVFKDGYCSYGERKEE